MNELDAPPVASSATDTPEVVTALDQAVMDNDVAAFRAASFAALTAKTPVPASSAAPPEVPAVSTDASPSPASEASKPTRKNAEDRVGELLAERAQLRAELDAIRRPQTKVDAQPAAPSAAPVGDKFPAFDVWTQQPGHEFLMYEDMYEAYIDARALNVYAREQQVAKERETLAMAQQEHRAQIASYRERAATFVADKPDYWDAIQPVVTAPQTPTSDAIGELIKRSEVAPQLLYHLGTHLEQFERLVGLPERLAIYELGKLEASLSAVPVTSQKPPTVTRASAPPTMLGSKPTTPSTDDASRAVASGDVAAYKAAWYREQLAMRR
jgi:hypothetical protein